MLKNVLITGGAGFIGAHLILELVKIKDFKLYVIDDLSGGFIENIPKDVTFIEGSILDDKLINEIFEKYQFEYVYHLAAYAAEGLSHFIRKFNYDNNLIGSINLINASVNNNVKCFVFTSSIAVYGQGQVPMIESMKPSPDDPYGIAKYAVELDLANAKKMFDLDYVIFRPHNVYGEFQNIGDKYRNVVGIFMNQILKDIPLTIFGNGDQQRAFSYVGDIIGPIAKAAWTPKAYGQVFNIGADLPLSVKELANSIKKILQKPDLNIKFENERNEVKIAFSDHAKVKLYFGETKTTSLEEGLLKMFQWVNKVGSRESNKFKNIEIRKGLPESWLK